MSSENIIEQMYISNLVYRYGPTKYKGRQYIQPIFSDEEWDNLLEKNKQEYEAFQNTVPTSISLLPQIEHPIICGSLQKYTIKNYETFQNRIRKLKSPDADKGFVITPKYDGCSLRIYFYPNGHVLCMNRNECDYGVDLTNRCQNILNGINKQYIQSLMQKRNLACIALRGEVIISQQTFQTEYAQTFASVQNATTSQITSMKENINADFVVYEFLPIKCLQRGEEIIDINLVPSYMHQLAYIKQIIRPENKTVVLPKYEQHDYIDLVQDSDVKFQEFYNKNNNNPYPCDGVVIKLNTYQKALFENKQRPLYQIAYKFPQTNYSTTPLQIEWSVNSQYELIPTLVVEPVKIGSKTITRIAMSNLNKCFEYDIFNKIQQKKSVQVCLAGSIIPQLTKDEQTQSIENMIKNGGQELVVQNILTNLSNPKIKPACCPQCQSEAIKLIYSKITSTKSQIQFKYICSERKCRNKIVSTKFLKHFKPYLKSVKINGKQAIGAATLAKLLVENDNNLDYTIVSILSAMYKQPNNIDRSVYYLTFCDNETETSIKQKLEQNQEQTLIDELFFNLRVCNMNLPLISQFIQKNVYPKNCVQKNCE